MPKHTVGMCILENTKYASDLTNIDISHLNAYGLTNASNILPQCGPMHVCRIGGRGEGGGGGVGGGSVVMSVF